MASTKQLNAADLLYASQPESHEAISSASSSKPKAPPRRRTYTNPCDACAIRRIRCDIQSITTGSCTNCASHMINCTNIRIKHKSGPKKIRQKTLESIRALVSHSAPLGDNININNININNQRGRTPQAFSLDQLLPFLQVYQTWYYCIWPVVSVAHLTSIITAKTVDSRQPLELDELSIAEAYVLSCSVCAAISRHKQLMKSTHALNFDNYPTSSEYAREAEMVSVEFDLRSHPSMNVLLTNFFLHTYFANVPNGSTKGMLYLRDTVTLVQMLGLHEPKFYVNKSKAEAHRCRKIYYLILVTERFMSFESGVPVLLEPSIHIPSLEDEEYSDLLLGFTDLAKVFSTTDRQFFEELHASVLKSAGNEAKASCMAQYSDSLQTQTFNVKKQWIYQLQKKLDRNIVNTEALLDSQKVNIFLSRSWIQSMSWLISSEHNLVNANPMSTADDYFCTSFPLKITKEFLIQTRGLPKYAFESNGRGVPLKLLVIANSLHHFTSLSTNHRDTSIALDQLSTIFKMIVRFKNDMEMSGTPFDRIADFLDAQQLDIRQSMMKSTTGVTCSMSFEPIEMSDDLNDLFSSFNSHQPTLTNSPSNSNGDNQSHNDNNNKEDDESPKTESLFSNFNGLSAAPYVDDLMKFNNPFQTMTTTYPLNEQTSINTDFSILPNPLACKSPYYGISDI